MLIYAGDGDVPDDADYRLVANGCEWVLLREEFEALQEILAPIHEAECDEFEQALREIREAQ